MMKGVIDTRDLVQVGFIVRDIEKTKKKFAEFLGSPLPGTVESGEYEVTRTEYKHEPAPEAKCLMAFFDVGPNVQIELIQPNEVPSTWRDYLDEHGEGIHHIAFRIKNMKEKIISCENFGMKLEQKGEYRRGNGRYAYMNASDGLKCMIELLENDDE